MACADSITSPDQGKTWKIPHIKVDKSNAPQQFVKGAKVSGKGGGLCSQRWRKWELDYVSNSLQTRLPKIMALFYYVHEEPSSERAESRTVQLRAYTIAEFEEIQIPASAYSTSHSLTTWIKCARLNSKEDEPLLSPSRQRTWIHVHVEFTISPLVFWTRHQCRGWAGRLAGGLPRAYAGLSHVYNQEDPP